MLVPTQGASVRLQVRPSPQLIAALESRLAPSQERAKLCPTPALSRSSWAGSHPSSEPGDRDKEPRSPGAGGSSLPRQPGWAEPAGSQSSQPAKMDVASCVPESCYVKLLADSGYTWFAFPYTWFAFPSSFSNPWSWRQKEFFPCPIAYSSSHLLTFSRGRSSGLVPLKAPCRVCGEELSSLWVRILKLFFWIHFQRSSPPLLGYIPNFLGLFSGAMWVSPIWLEHMLQLLWTTFIQLCLFVQNLGSDHMLHSAFWKTE